MGDRRRESEIGSQMSEVRRAKGEGREKISDTGRRKEISDEGYGMGLIDGG